MASPRSCKGCRTLISGAWYCPRCKAARGYRVPNPNAPDYGWAHQQKRAAEREAAYGTDCARCGEVMLKPGKIHLDHDDTDPTRYLGFSHDHCNLLAGARKGRARQLGREVATEAAPAAAPTRPRPSRDW